MIVHGIWHCTKFTVAMHKIDMIYVYLRLSPMRASPLRNRVDVPAPFRLGARGVIPLQPRCEGRAHDE